MLVKESNLSAKFPKPFFLYVGNFYPHKNVERLLRAFSEIKNDIQLVLVGPNDYFCKRITSLIDELKLTGKVKLCPDASDEDLLYYYKNAQALVHPSLSEGFGLPVIEANYFGLPVIASDIPVFKEILGNNYISFNPQDIKDIQNKVELFLKEKNTTRYKTKLKDFSFEKMTKELLKIYQTT